MVSLLHLLLSGKSSSFGLWGLVVEDNAEESTSIGTELSHLLLKLSLVLSWELLVGLSSGGKLAHEDEHILGEVLGDGAHLALSWVRGAHAPDVEGRALEVTGSKVTGNLGELTENAEVSLDVLKLEHLEWVLDHGGQGDDVLDGGVIEAVGHLLVGGVHLVEGSVVSIVEVLEALNSASSLLNWINLNSLWDNFWLGGGSTHECDKGVELHFLFINYILIPNNLYSTNAI